MFEKSIKLLKSIFGKKQQDCPSVDVLLEASLSFLCQFQVWFRNCANQPELKEVRGQHFSTQFSLPDKDNRIELLAFVHNPKQLLGQTITLSISARGEKITSSTFNIETDKPHSGWHKIAADL